MGSYLQNLVPVLNLPIIGRLFRRLLWIDDSYHRIVELLPYCYHVDLGDGKYKAVIYINNQYDEAARKNLGWLLSFLHLLDTQIINRLRPAWNLGFDSYSVQPDGAAGLDTRMLSALPTTNYGTNPRLDIGEHRTANNIGRVLLEFNLAPIPTGSEITAFTVSLWKSGNDANNNRTLRVYRVLRDWVELEATWNIYSTGNNWGTAGCANTTTDREATEIGSLALILAGVGERQWELDGALNDYAEVEAMIGGGPSFTNNGFLFKADTEDADLYYFRSSDYGTAADRPKVAVTYTPPPSAPKIFFFS